MKLVHSLSVNFSFPLKAETLYTTRELLQPVLRKVLVEDGFSSSVIHRIIAKVQEKLAGLVEVQDLQGHGDTGEGEIKELKLNIFQCCHLVLE